MKVFLIIALATACLGLDVDSEWESYKENFGKFYTNHKEELFRKSIFAKHLMNNEEHNKLYAAGKVTYSLGITQFMDWTEEEFRALMTPIKVTRNPNTPIFQYNSSIKVADSIDWRAKGAVTPVKNQGTCGSCYTFASTGALEGALFVKAGQLVSMSEQNLLDCTRDLGNFGCKGGFPEKCFDYVREHGIDREEAYQYQDMENSCRFRQEAVATKISSYQYLNNEQSLQQAVSSVGPVAVLIDASQLAQTYFGGIVTTPCTASQPDHAVLAVGYGSENGQDYWIIKNSWGESWGEQGYFRIARNQDLCFIGDHGVYPIV